MQDVGSYRESAPRAGETSPHDARIPGMRRPAPKRARRASLALALSRLEREHVALLLAICELETPDPADPNSSALRAALLPMLRDDLRQTQRALARAARGLYGICEECHKPLTARQLELTPAATRCATCQGRDRRATRAALKD